ncbi:MAG: hypothetical protein E7220_00030 [Clostridiales bacterium]|nr:hypothetical protein [Clostridiales bacterium]
MDIRRKADLAIRMLAFIAEQKRCGSKLMKDNNVLFISDVRDEMGGNFECVNKALIESGRKWNIDVFLKDKQLHKETLRDARLIARKLRSAKYIFLEDVFNYLQFYKLLPGQEIIQLWHAEGAYKKFGFSRKGEDIKISPGHRKYTKAIVSAASIRGCYAEAYGISEDKVIPTGIPRTDVFCDESWTEEVRKRFVAAHPEIGDRKIIFLAPTYRGTKVPMADYDMSKVPVDRLREKYGDEYVLITKMHPAAYNNMKMQGRKLGDDSGFWIDVSDVRDVNDILPAADILITDYSSIIFDWLLLDRPVIYYVYDRDEYAGDRGMYYPFEDYVYGTVAETADELIEAIAAADMMEDKRGAFRERFMSACDGHATERVLELLD